MLQNSLVVLKDITIMIGQDWSSEQNCWVSSYYKYDSSNNWVLILGEELKRVKLQLHLLRE